MSHQAKFQWMVVCIDSMLQMQVECLKELARFGRSFAFPYLKYLTDIF